MQILAIGPGTAQLCMAVRQDMLNGHQICHGGLMTTLADSTFAFACNAYNELTVASGFDVNIIASAKLGDTLTAPPPPRWPRPAAPASTTSTCATRPANASPPSAAGR